MAYETNPSHIINAAITGASHTANGQLSAAQVAATGARAAQPGAQHRPHITATGNGTDAFRAEAVDALLFAATKGKRGANNRLASTGHGAILRESLRLHGIDAAGDSLAEMAQSAMNLSASGVNRVGDFPNIMHAVSAVLMDSAATLAETTYQRFAEELPPAQTMDGVSLGGFGVIDTLDAHVDGDNVTEKKLVEESKGYLKPVHYANDVCLTWMMASDALKFNQFLRALADLSTAGMRQLNRAIIASIANNDPTIVDNVPLFHADHGNLVTGGGAPSETNLAINRELHAAQRPPGATDISDADPRLVLVPSALRVTATRAFRTLLGTGGMAVANVEQNQAYFKDAVEVLSEPMLDAYSTSHWYSLVDPTNQGLRSFVYRYLAGYEPNRPMMQYHDHRKRGICFAVDFVAGFAVTRHRGIVRNNG